MSPSRKNNPFHNLLALYMVAKQPGTGRLGEGRRATLNPTRRPASSYRLRQHPPAALLPLQAALPRRRASPLITPPGCGTYTVQADLYPWSGSEQPGLRTRKLLQDRPGRRRAALPDAGALPFHPGFEAGTLNNPAGAYSPFAMRLTRSDGEQDMTKFSLRPAARAWSARSPASPNAREAGIAQARRQGADGRARSWQAPPARPPRQIGTTVAGAGVGSTLTYVAGKLYLAGPYHGDPPQRRRDHPAVAGPFDVGTVVVQEALTLNPVTGRSRSRRRRLGPDPPHPRGHPAERARHPRLRRPARIHPQPDLLRTLARPGRRSGAGAPRCSPTGDDPGRPRLAASRPPAAPPWASSPKLAIKLKGGTRRGKFPAAAAPSSRPRPGDANFSRPSSRLPHSAFLEQGHFGTICTRVQFAAGAGNGAGCPAASVYGTRQGLEPAAGRTARRPGLPALLLPQPARPGRRPARPRQRRPRRAASTPSTAASAPPSKASPTPRSRRFILEMQGGKKGLIVNSTNLCKKPSNRAEADLTGQNGRLDQVKPVVQPQCRAHRKHTRHHKRKHKHKRRHRRAGSSRRG